MAYQYMYETPEGFSDLIMNSDGEKLTGLWFAKAGDSSARLLHCEKKDFALFRETVRWLDIYFSGKNPDFMPKYEIADLTPFRQRVLAILHTIPFGATVTYNDIAKRIAKESGMERMSAQAVGGAVARNPICIIIPCHRVIGARGKLTGYSGGIPNKIALLEHEKNDMTKYDIPKSCSAFCAKESAIFAHREEIKCRNY